MEDKDLIQILLKGTEELEVKDGHEEEWLSLDRKLSEKSFFRFSFNKFNIFYAALILLTFIISTFTSVHYMLHVHEYESSLQVKVSDRESTENKPARKGNPELLNTEKPLVTNPSSMNESPVKEELKVIKGENSEGKPTKDLISLKADSIRPAKPKIDTLKTINKIGSENPAIVPEVKQVIIIKQDTIFEYDSVKVKPGLRLWKNR